MNEEEALRDRLMSYAAHVEPPIPEWNQAVRRANRGRIRRISAAAFALLVAGATLTVVWRISDGSLRETRHDGYPAFLEPLGPAGSAPIPGGVETSLSAATSAVTFPVLRPDDPLASDASLTEVWVSESGVPQVALEYASGILVLVKQVEFSDPVAKYEAIQKDFGSSYVTKIGNAPALVLTGNIPGRAPSIDMVIGEVNVQIQGRTGPFTVEDILRVAASIPQT